MPVYPTGLFIQQPFQETPGGPLNGTNVTFTLTNAPAANTLNLYKNGLMLSAVDYTLSGTTITMQAAPYSGDTLYATYRY